MNATNSPYKAVGIGSDFHYTIYNIADDGYKRIVAYDIRKNDMYMIMKHSGTWGKWRKVCTTSVKDVPKTVITSENTNITLNENCAYEVINGICYVSLWGFQSTVTGKHVICASMPKTKVIKQSMCCYGSEGKTGANIFINDGNNGKLYAEINVTGQPLYGAFSYPVKES